MKSAWTSHMDLPLKKTILAFSHCFYNLNIIQGLDSFDLPISCPPSHRNNLGGLAATSASRFLRFGDAGRHASCFQHHFPTWHDLLPSTQSYCHTQNSSSMAPINKIKLESSNFGVFADYARNVLINCLGYTPLFLLRCQISESGRATKSREMEGYLRFHNCGIFHGLLTLAACPYLTQRAAHFKGQQRMSPSPRGTPNSAALLVLHSSSP